MDLDSHSPSDSAGAKAAFHKPSNDPANRKYRRRSPVSGSSSSDGEPVHERNSTPTRSHDDNPKLNDNQQRKDDRWNIDRDHKRSHYSRDDGSYRNTSKRSYDRHRHDDHRRREKYAEDDQKNFPKSSRGGSGSHGSYSDHSRRESEQNRSRDGSGHRSRDKHKRDDEKRDYPKASKEPRGHRAGYHHKDASWRDSKELDDLKYTRVEKGKVYDQETKRHFKEPRELIDDTTGKKPKLFSTEKGTDANEVQSSSSKQGPEFVGKASAEQDCLKESDIDAAKIAAMKAAELVNRNLIGTGFMSTDQKKKLLWGSKKSTATEETAHRWDTSTFSDRERQEKFKKLMSLRLEWEIVGCEGGAGAGAEDHGGPRQQSRGKAERAADGLGEAVHCRASSQRWSYCRFRPLNKSFLATFTFICLLYLRIVPFNYFTF